MGCPTALVTAVAAVIFSPGALLTPTPKIALFGRIPRAGGVNRFVGFCVVSTLKNMWVQFTLTETVGSSRLSEKLLPLVMTLEDILVFWTPPQLHTHRRR